jgi:hypothetical protein
VSDRDADCRCYAVRRLNPFEGVLQVVESGSARAYSADGRGWQVQVLSRRPDHTWRSASDAAPVEQFFNFGLWDAASGLHRVRANPVMDIGAMQAAAERLVGHLRGIDARLPFALADRFERWLTDDDGQPVALLAATDQRGRLADIRVTRWQAVRAPDHGFIAPSLLACGETDAQLHAGRLEAQVGHRGRHVAWYERDPDGRGTRVHPGSSARPDGDPAAGAGAHELAAAAFPELGLTQDWDDPAARALTEDYLAWRAPRLLMLQHISRDRRAWLEGHACRQATELASGYRLFPDIVDRARVEAARVEARLRRCG